jgi:hypothetical protein
VCIFVDLIRILQQCPAQPGVLDRMYMSRSGNAALSTFAATVPSIDGQNFDVRFAAVAMQTQSWHV